MWNWIVEHPLKLFLYAAVPAGILIYASTVLPEKRGLAKAGVALMGTALLLAIAGWFTETEADAVQKILYAAAEAVEQNEIDRAMGYISPSRPELKARAESELKRYEFLRVAVKSNLEIKVDMDHSPPRAVARFNVVAVLKSRDGALGKINVPRYVILEFEKEGNTWRITGFEHDEPLPHMRNRG